MDADRTKLALLLQQMRVATRGPTATEGKHECGEIPRSDRRIPIMGQSGSTNNIRYNKVLAGNYASIC